MKVFRQSQVDHISKAVAVDPTIQTTLEALKDSCGHTEEYLAVLGISKGLLKRLEVWGLSKRGYKKTGAGHQCVWMLVSPEVQDAVG